MSSQLCSTSSPEWIFRQPNPDCFWTKCSGNWSCSCTKLLVLGFFFSRLFVPTPPCLKTANVYTASNEIKAENSSKWFSRFTKTLPRCSEQTKPALIAHRKLLELSGYFKSAQCAKINSKHLKKEQSNHEVNETGQCCKPDENSATKCIFMHNVFWMTMWGQTVCDASLGRFCFVKVESFWNVTETWACP